MKHQPLRKKLLDEITQLVILKIKETLATTPEYPHQAVFAIRYYQRQLLLRVIKEMYGHYRITQDESPDPIKMLYFCLIEETTLASLVQQNAIKILEEDACWMNVIRSAGIEY